MIRSILKGIATAWFVATLAFLCLRLSPGDPVERILGTQARPEQIELYRHKLGLDQPLINQYSSFMSALSRFDFGQSLFRDRLVIEMISEAIKPTATLAIISIILAFFLGSFMGITAALYRGGWRDHCMRFLALGILAFPIFSLGPLMIMLFAIKLQFLPVSELIGIKHYILPVMSLTLPLASVLSRVVRNQYLEYKHEPWANVLLAKGLSPLTIVHHIYKVCLPTVLNVVSMQLSVILAGAMITETIFDIPGLGRLLLTAIENRDYPVVQGLMIYTSFIYLTLYILTDVINRKIDPRLEVA